MFIWFVLWFEDFVWVDRWIKMYEERIVVLVDVMLCVCGVVWGWGFCFWGVFVVVIWYCEKIM